MTKETKIGLLVGLTFIIIVGILLGDTVRNATTVPQAEIVKVADSVRNAVTTPGTPTVPPISLQGHEGALNAGPQQTVPTHEEVSRTQSGVVVVGPGESPHPQLMVNSRGNHEPRLDLGGPGAENRVENRTDNRSDNNHPGPAAPNPHRANSDPLHQFAQQIGEELEPIGSRPNANNPLHPPQNSPLAAAKTYQAGPGDSLSKIAAKFYGSGTKPYREAIINANPSLKQNPDRIIAGQTYTIPAFTIPTVESAASASPPATTPLPASRGGAGSPAAAAEYFYTVKENDNLWRIARDQVGDSNAVATLKELNKDILKGGETVRVNMKLRLPGKPVTN